MKVHWGTGAVWVVWGLFMLYGSFTIWIPHPGFANVALSRGFDLLLIAAGLVILFRRLW